SSLFFMHPPTSPLYTLSLHDALPISYPHFDVPSQLRRLAFHGRPAPADWSFDFSGVLARSEPVDAGILTLAERGATVIDLPALLDRKSTCLNSSHVKISYAVFCLKKK